MRRPMVPFAAVLALASMLAMAPTAAVLACSCGWSGFPVSIARADVAFVGTVVATDEPPLDQLNGMDEAAYTFDVTLAKAPMDGTFTVISTFGGGANCGFDMSVGDEWLVLANLERGQMRTNLCHGTTPIGGLDADTQSLVGENFVEIAPAASARPSEVAAVVEASTGSAGGGMPERHDSVRESAIPLGVLGVGLVGVAVGVAVVVRALRRAS